MADTKHTLKQNASNAADNLKAKLQGEADRSKQAVNTEGNQARTMRTNTDNQYR